MRGLEFDTRRRKWAFGVAAAVLVPLVFVLPISVPYTITTTGKILCTSEWIVALNRDGGIVTFIADRASGITRHYSLAQFSRGDAMSFSIDAEIAGGSSIIAGDTVGIARSSEVARELERLRGELQNATAALAVAVTGEKQSIVEEAVQSVEHAKRQAEEYNSVLARQKLLFDRGLVSEQEYEFAQRQAATSTIAVSIAEARLRSVTTGAKKEQADFVRAQIKSLQSEIHVLERQEKEYRLIAPISGIVTQVGKGDTLLVVSDTTGYVVVMPVSVHERTSVLPEQQVRLYASEVGNIPRAAVSKVDKTIHSLNGQQVVLATAQLVDMPEEVLNGLLARCTIECESLSPFEFVKRKFQSLVR